MHIAYTITEAAKLIRVNPVTIRAAIKSGKLKAAQIGNKDWRISAQDLEAWYQTLGGGRLFPEPPLDDLPPAIKAALGVKKRLSEEPTDPWDEEEK